VDSFEGLEAKTKSMIKILTALKVGDQKVLLIIPDNAPETKELLHRAAGNLPNVKPLLVNYLNMDDMFKYDRVVMPLAALDWINEKLGEEQPAAQAAQ